MEILGVSDADNWYVGEMFEGMTAMVVNSP